MSNKLNLNQPFGEQSFNRIPEDVSQDELKFQRLKVYGSQATNRSARS